MKFSSASKSYFATLPERFTCELMDVNVVQGSDLIVGDMSSLIYVDENLDSQGVVSLFCEKSLKHIVQKNNEFFEEDLWTTGNLIQNPQSYFSIGAKSLIENSTSSYKIQFAEKPHKVMLKEESYKFVSESGSQSLVEAADAVIEELYMNATIDAPREAALKGISAYGKAVNTLELERNENRLVISCTDPFGTLNIKKFLDRMNEVYAKGAGEVINLRGQGGAGLGCVIMFEHSMSIYLGVDKNRCTRVSCVLPVGMNNRQRASVKKSLHSIDLGN